MQKNTSEKRRGGSGTGEEPQSLKKGAGKLNAKHVTNLLAPSLFPKPGGHQGWPLSGWRNGGVPKQRTHPCCQKQLAPETTKPPNSWSPISASEHSWAKINAGTPWWRLGAGRKFKMSPNTAQSFQAKPHQNHPDRC